MYIIYDVRISNGLLWLFFFFFFFFFFFQITTALKLALNSHYKILLQ